MNRTLSQGERLRMGRYVGFIVVMLSRRVIAYYFPIHSEARGGCFIYLFTCGYLGDGEQRHNWIECAWLFLLLGIQNLILFGILARWSRNRAFLFCVRWVSNCLICWWEEKKEWVWEKWMHFVCWRHFHFLTNLLKSFLIPDELWTLNLFFSSKLQGYK